MEKPTSKQIFDYALMTMLLMLSFPLAIGTGIFAYYSGYYYIAVGGVVNLVLQLYFYKKNKVELDG